MFRFLLPLNIRLVFFFLSSQCIQMVEVVCTDSTTEINTLSHAELPYQSSPCGAQVDMDTVNRAESALLTVLKGQPGIISLSWVRSFYTLGINLATKELNANAVSFSFLVTLRRVPRSTRLQTVMQQIGSTDYYFFVCFWLFQKFKH